MKLRKILLVDDEEAYLFLNEYFLRNSNIQCPIEMAYNGQEALDMIDTAGQKPDLILLDLQMPGMNGLEFLAAFAPNAHSQNTKIFVLSSSEFEEEKTAVLAYKFVHGFIAKPLDKSAVQHILKHFTLVD